MEDLPNEPGKRIEFEQSQGFDPTQTEKLLTDLTTLLKFKKSAELIATFQAGTIPIVLDVLSRDSTDRGRKVVDALLKQIDELKTYYEGREPKATTTEGDALLVK